MTRGRARRWRLPAPPRGGPAAGAAASQEDGPLARCCASRRPACCGHRPAGPAARPGREPRRRRPLCFGPAPATARRARGGARGARGSDPVRDPGTGSETGGADPGSGSGSGSGDAAGVALRGGARRTSLSGTRPETAGRRAELGALSRSRASRLRPRPRAGREAGVGGSLGAPSFRRSRNREGGARGPRHLWHVPPGPPARSLTSRRGGGEGPGARGAGGGLRAGGHRCLTRARGLCLQ